MRKEKTPHSIGNIVPGVLPQARKATMQSKTIKAVIVCASSAGIFIATANAQPNITWQTPVTISGVTNVSTLGALYGTWAPGNDYGGVFRADYYPVNGVTFAAY